MPAIIYPDKFWNQAAVTNFTADVSGAGGDFAITVFNKAPTFETGDTYFGGPNGVEFVTGDATSTPPETIDDLLNSPFWQVPEGLPQSDRLTDGHFDLIDVSGTWEARLAEGGNPAPRDNGFFLGLTNETFRVVTVAAAIWYVGTPTGGLHPTNPLVALIRFDDELVAHALDNTDTDYPTANDWPLYVGMEDWVVQYNEGTGASPALGKLEFQTPFIGYESARETHIDMIPERANMVVNPSFEATDGTFGWRSNATMTPTASTTPAPLGPNPRTTCMQVDAGPATLILESLPFPTQGGQDPFWSIEAGIAGTGQVRFGLTTWEDQTGVAGFLSNDWFDVQSSNFQTFRYLAQIHDRTFFASFRVEFIGSEFFIDNVMADNNGGQLGYFDGDWHMGMDGDFSWYGEEFGANPHESYSLFYNDRQNVDTMLFGYSERVAQEGIVSDVQNFTATEVTAMGYNPATVTVVVNADMTIREAWDEFQSYGTSPNIIGVSQDGGVVGYLPNPLSLLSKLVHHPGEAQLWVPEGARVIPHWNDVYRFTSTAPAEDVYVPVQDFIDKSVVAYVEE